MKENIYMKESSCQINTLNIHCCSIEPLCEHGSRTHFLTMFRERAKLFRAKRLQACQNNNKLALMRLIIIFIFLFLIFIYLFIFIKKFLEKSHVIDIMKLFCFKLFVFLFFLKYFYHVYIFKLNKFYK